MGGQVLGGGVVVLVAALLWLVYLLPSLHSRHRYDSAERNAVRLNQALRILAETSETPTEVRLELSARTAMQQQRLAKRAQAERELAGLQHARDELDAARALPDARRARARRRARLLVAVLGVVAVGFAGWGAWEVVSSGSQVLLWSAVGVAVICGVMLQRMARVRARTAVRIAAPVVEAAPVVATRAMPEVQLLDAQAWTPRRLPRPLTSSAGSRAAAVLDAEVARDELRQAARHEAVRAEAERRRPPSLAEARRARAEARTGGRPAFADDAEIEAHVRQLLQRRAAGE